MLLRDLVSPEDLKEVNLLLLLEGAKQVGGAELRRRTRARAKMVQNAKLQQMLDEIPEVARKAAPNAWSHWMALVTTRQPFFDANHRTALMGFNLATTKEWGFEYTLETRALETMMVGSRKLVQDVHRPGPTTPRNASVESLRNPEHPVRRFYAGFEENLKEVNVQ